MKARILLLGGSIFLLSNILFNLFLLPRLSKSMTKLIVGSVDISVEIANTTERQIKGLSGRASLDENSGMYFVFQGNVKRSIWMKDMKFPIDVIWVREGRVVEITENITPLGGNLPIITSKEEVDAFLEVKAGFANKNRIKVGERVGIQPSRGLNP